MKKDLNFQIVQNIPIKQFPRITFLMLIKMYF